MICKKYFHFLKNNNESKQKYFAQLLQRALELYMTLKSLLKMLYMCQMTLSNYT